MRRNSHKLISFVICLFFCNFTTLVVCAGVSENQCDSVTEAILCLNNSNKEIRDYAEQYLSNNQDEAIPQLVDAVKNRNDSFYNAVWLLSTFDDERVFDFFLHEALYEDRRTYSYFSDAIKYLAKYPEKSTPLMIGIIKNREDGWTSALMTLKESKDEKALYFLIDELKDNFYEKDDNGNRKEFGLGSPHGCIVKTNFDGGLFAEALGDLGDKRAIPALEEAVSKGDSHVRTKAYHALYDLGYISLEDLFNLAIEESRSDANKADIVGIIVYIGNSLMNSDTRYAIEIFDRVIEDFPEEYYQVADAYFLKIECFIKLKEYDNAINECNNALKFTQFDTLVSSAEKIKNELISCINGDTSKCDDLHNREFLTLK